MADAAAVPIASFDATRYFLMGAMVLAGACLQGVGGLGFAMFCAPIAALSFPELVPGPLLALGFPLAAMAMVREFRDIDWRVAAYSIAGRAGGAALALGMLQMLAADTLAVVFALLILAAVGLSIRGWRVTPTPGISLTAGVASGVMGTITSAGAPPLAIAMQEMPPARLRATIGAVFLAGSAISLAALALAGRMGAGHLVLAALLVPWMVAGFAVSGPLAKLMPRRRLRHMLLALAAGGALALLARELLRG